MNLKTTAIMASILAIFSSCGTCKNKLADQIKSEWAIEEVYGLSTETAQNPAVIAFQKNGEVNGNASVNSFFGSYKLNGNKLKFDKLGMTKMMGASMDIEDAITKALGNTATIEIEGDTAVIKDESGQKIMSLKRK